MERTINATEVATTKIVNQKSMLGDKPIPKQEEPIVIVYTDIRKYKVPGTIWNLYGKESIQAMIEVCEDALKE